MLAPAQQDAGLEPQIGCPHLDGIGKPFLGVDLHGSADQLQQVRVETPANLVITGRWPVEWPFRQTPT